MTNLPIAHTWDDIKPGIESIASTELTGWRTGPVVDDGFVTPFMWGLSIGAKCSLKKDFQRHDGHKVHPGCTCGLSFTATRDQAISYLRRDRELGNVSAQKRGYEANFVAFHGYAICKVSVLHGWHVTGPAQRPDLHPTDPEWCARSSQLFLEEVEILSDVPSRLRNQVQKRYSAIPVSQLDFNLKEVTQSYSAQMPVNEGDPQ